jgi:hypothetical protein
VVSPHQQNDLTTYLCQYIIPYYDIFLCSTISREQDGFYALPSLPKYDSTFFEMTADRVYRHGAFSYQQTSSPMQRRHPLPEQGRDCCPGTHQRTATTLGRNLAAAFDRRFQILHMTERRIALFAYLHVTKQATAEMCKLPIQAGKLVVLTLNAALACEILKRRIIRYRQRDCIDNIP